MSDIDGGHVVFNTNLPYTTTYNIEGLTNGNTTIEFTSGETTNYLSRYSK